MVITTMTEEKIARINALAHKMKTAGLTEEEKAEQAALRKEYIASVVGDLKNQLDNTYVVDGHGNKTKIAEANGRRGLKQ